MRSKAQIRQLYKRREYYQKQRVQAVYSRMLEAVAEAEAEITWCNKQLDTIHNRRRQNA